MARQNKKKVTREIWQNNSTKASEDQVACETPIAFVYNGISHFVMMATPSDIEDFVYGISFTEGIIERKSEIYDIQVQHVETGVEVNIDISSRAFSHLKGSRRLLAGVSGCGICGKESLEQFRLSSSRVESQVKIKNIAIQTAIQSISEYQELNNMTGAVHGAAWCDLEGNILSIREDVGRHNALDKLIGHIIKQKVGKLGFITVTSRASFEMVNKVAISKVPLLVAVSAPTSMAVDTAKMCGVSLIGFARPNRHVIYNNNLNIVDEDN